MDIQLDLPLDSFIRRYGAPQPLRPIVNTTDIPVDVIETNDQIIVYAEIPGVEKNKLDVDFYNNKMTILIEKNRPYFEPQIAERKFGNIERSITLPICITKRETVKVSLKNGILCVKIDKFVEESNRFRVGVNDEEDEKSD